MPHTGRHWIAAIAAFTAASWAVSVPAAGEAVHYSLDPVHTRVMFAIEHAGFSKAIGTVSGSTGSLVFDPDDWASTKLQASVPMARVDLGDTGWNKATLAGNLLDVEDHPGRINHRLLARQGGEPVRNGVGADGRGEDAGGLGQFRIGHVKEDATRSRRRFRGRGDSAGKIA